MADIFTGTSSVIVHMFSFYFLTTYHFRYIIVSFDDATKRTKLARKHGAE